MKNPKVAIIILNWNGWKDTIECLESLYQIDYPNYNVIVLDNASKDNSLGKIREYCEGRLIVQSSFFKFNPKNKPIKVFEYKNERIDEKKIENIFKKFPSDKKLILIKNDKNYGFTEGNNIGIRFALKKLKADYVLLLNNDTVVDKYFLTELVNVAENDQKIGFIGPKVYYYDFNGRNNIINFAGGKQNIWKFKPSHIGYKRPDTGQYDKNYEVDYVHGCCLLAKSEMLKEIGLFDKEYISYREENDWAIRAYKKGWKSFYAYESKIWHKIAGSTKKTDNILVHYLETRNRFLFVKKNSNTSQKITFLLYFLIIDFWIISAILLLYFRNQKKYKCFLRGVKDGIKILAT